MNKMNTTKIGFKNPYKPFKQIPPDLDKIDDETEFDSHDEDELAKCWFEFCKENGIITYVEKEYEVGAGRRSIGMKSNEEIRDYCIKQVCEYYASHRDLLNGAAGVIEPRDVNVEYMGFGLGSILKLLVLSTTAADGMRFHFDISDHYDATKINITVYRIYDTPKEMII